MDNHGCSMNHRKSLHRTWKRPLLRLQLCKGYLESWDIVSFGNGFSDMFSEVQGDCVLKILRKSSQTRVLGRLGHLFLNEMVRTQSDIWMHSCRWIVLSLDDCSPLFICMCQSLQDRAMLWIRTSPMRTFNWIESIPHMGFCGPLYQWGKPHIFQCWLVKLLFIVD